MSEQLAPEVPAQPQAPAKKGLAVTALVLGIVAIVGSWIPILNIMSILIAIVGLVFGVIAIVKSLKATAGGKVMAIVGTALAALAIVLALVVNAATVAAVDDALDEVGSEVVAEEAADEVVAEEAADDVIADESSDDSAADDSAADDTTSTIENGDHLVGVDLEPGQYRAGVEQGLFEVCMITQEDENGDIMDVATATSGNVILTIKDVKGSVASFDGCENIQSTNDVPGEAVSEISNGYYLVGAEITAGKYQGVVDEDAIIPVGLITQYKKDNSIVDVNTGDSGKVIFTVKDIEGSVVNFSGLKDISKIN